jgi:hypothetical protein
MERRLEEEEQELKGEGESPKGSGLLVLKDVWHMIEPSFYFTYRDFERLGLTPFHPRYVICEGTFGCGPIVLALGHKVAGLKWGSVDFKHSLSDE